MNYELSEDTTQEKLGITFKKLYAVESFKIDSGGYIEAGTVGGWVEDINSLNGNSWVYEGSYLSAGNALHGSSIGGEMRGEKVELLGGNFTIINSRIRKMVNYISSGSNELYNTLENVRIGLGGELTLYGNNNYLKNIIIDDSFYIAGNENYIAGQPKVYHEILNEYESNDIRMIGFVLLNTDGVVIDCKGAEFNSTSFFGKPTIIKGDYMEFGACYLNDMLIEKQEDHFFIHNIANHHNLTFAKNGQGEVVCNGLNNDGATPIKELRSYIHKNKTGNDYKVLSALFDLAEVKFQNQ